MTMTALQRRRYQDVFDATYVATGSRESAYDRAIATMTRFGWKIALEDVDIVDDDVFWEEQRVKVVAQLEPLMREIFDAGVSFGRTLDVTGYVGKRSFVARLRGRRDFLDPDPNYLDDEAGRVFRTYMDDWWRDLSRSTRRSLRAAISESVVNGEGVNGVIARLEAIFGPARARRIAVTETTRLFGRGAQATFRAAGVTEWLWMTAQDDRVDPDCDALAAGGPYPMSQDFDPAHVSCRCWPAPIVQ